MSPAEYKATRERLGMTQAALAVALDVSRKAINQREQGGTITREAAMALELLALRSPKRSRKSENAEHSNSHPEKISRPRTTIKNQRTSPKRPDCEHRWKWPSRDALSPSGENCPRCDEWCFPYHSEIDATIPCDDMGNLTVPWNWTGQAPNSDSANRQSA